MQLNKKLTEKSMKTLKRYSLGKDGLPSAAAIKAYERDGVKFDAYFVQPINPRPEFPVGTRAALGSLECLSSAVLIAECCLHGVR